MKKQKIMSDGTKAQIVIEKNGESFQQVVTGVGTYKLWVKSSKGNQYPVDMSDKVRMTMKVEVGDIAVIKKFKRAWIVFDIIKQEPEQALSDDEEEEELKRQEKELEDIGWGEY